MENEYQEHDGGRNVPSDQLSKKERKTLRREEKQQLRKRSEQKRAVKRMAFWAVSVFVLVALGFGIVKFLGSKTQTGGNILTDEVSADDWVRGSSEAPVLVVEYADFQCPACASFYLLLKQLEADFPDDVRVVFRHFPLQQIHQNAGLAAEAAEAAGRQGQFWEMHDMLFEHQTEWSNQRNAEETFQRYAQTLGLDVNTFSADIGDAGIKDKIDEQYASGVRSSVRGTPTLFVNGAQIQNPRSYEQLQSYIMSLIPNS